MDQGDSMSTHDTLPARLRAVRHLRGMTQQDAADLIKVSRNTVTRWELGTMRFHPAQRVLVEDWVAYWLDKETP